jgi:hypothetical protein
VAGHSAGADAAPEGLEKRFLSSIPFIVTASPSGCIAGFGDNFRMPTIQPDVINDPCTLYEVQRFLID